MFVAERFIDNLIKIHGKNPIVSTDDAGTWYPQAWFLKLRHHIHSPLEKGIIERTIQYIKDRTELFDNYFPCRKEEICNLFPIKNWINLFVGMHNKEMINT